jgi:hypothetical protein
MALIQYAIRSETPEHELVREGRSITNYYTFTLVPQSVAETDEDNGMYSIFTNTGEQASPWTKIHAPYIEEELAKLKPFPAMADMFNTPLNIGDYALSAFSERSNYVSLCRVVGFTAKQVRVHHFGWNTIMSRNAAMLVRVHDSIITPETS